MTWTSNIPIYVASIIGLVVGFYLGSTTERTWGLLTVAGAVLGAGVGAYIGQLILTAPRDED